MHPSNSNDKLLKCVKKVDVGCIDCIFRDIPGYRIPRECSYAISDGPRLFFGFLRKVTDE